MFWITYLNSNTFHFEIFARFKNMQKFFNFNNMQKFFEKFGQYLQSRFVEPTGTRGVFLRALSAHRKHLYYRFVAPAGTRGYPLVPVCGTNWD